LRALAAGEAWRVFFARMRLAAWMEMPRRRAMARATALKPGCAVRLLTVFSRRAALRLSAFIHVPFYALTAPLRPFALQHRPGINQQRRPSVEAGGKGRLPGQLRYPEVVYQAQ